MPTVSLDELITKAVSGELTPGEVLLSIIDRESGRLLPVEGRQLDFKSGVSLDTPRAIGELARDVLAFANTDGGLILFGVADDGEIVGHDSIDSLKLRMAIGPYAGTRIGLELFHRDVTVRGRNVPICGVVVRKSEAHFPTLLRRDIEIRGLIRKVKYSRGSLFFRNGDQVLVEPSTGDLDARAVDLGFSGAAPRTRSSFVLREDRPLLRLYASINDRFFGRVDELADLSARFDDPRGRGVSLAGLGGIGKTELAIRVASRLYEQGKFRKIYSGSAKTTVLGPAGAQAADPVFWDFPSFLSDVAAWLGLEIRGKAIDELQRGCLEELKRHGRLLLLVDNLETINDRRLIKFLDDEVPDTVWLLVTGRIHKLRTYIYQSELGNLDQRSGARLLRHELKRQGLDDLASSDIQELETRANNLFLHPLALRWYAWAVRQDSLRWTTSLADLPKSDLEQFCTADTLGSIGADAQRCLAAVGSIETVLDATLDCVQAVSGLTPFSVEQSLFDGECSGLLQVSNDPENGEPLYTLAPLAVVPVAELAQRSGWEREFVKNLKGWLAQKPTLQQPSGVVRELLSIQLYKIRNFTPDELRELDDRCVRALETCPEESKYYLLALRAECQRHQGNIVSADELFKRSAERILSGGTVGSSEHQKIRSLVEAATVAKMRLETEAQLTRAVEYLVAVQHTSIAAHRVLGMLCELYALLGNRAEYERYRLRATDFLNRTARETNQSQRDALREAIRRAGELMGVKNRRRGR